MSISEIILWGTAVMVFLVFAVIITFFILYNRSLKKKYSARTEYDWFHKKDPDIDAAIVGADPGHYVDPKYRGPNYDGPYEKPKPKK